MLPRITVRKMLIDGRQWGTWQAYVLPLERDEVALWTPQGTEMRWATGDFRASYNGLHYWWPGARYLIGAHYAGAGGDEFWGCYCDVVMPLAARPADAPEREYVDLLLDLVVRPDRSWYSKDQEVYDRAERVVPALRAERAAADETLRWLEVWARDWSGPFARIPAWLPRTDWHELDPDSAELAESVGGLLA
jgi:hypothetical protein